MRTAFCITKAKNTQSEYIIVIAFPLQQWFQKRASMLRHTYNVNLVIETYATLRC